MVGTLIIAVVALLLAGAVLLTMRPVFNRSQLEYGRELKRRTKSLSREQRRAVRTAVRGGRAVADPRTAALAADLAGNARRLMKRLHTRRSRSLVLVLELALAAALIARAVRDPGPELVFGALPLVLALASQLTSGRLVKRLARAEEANRQLAEQFLARDDAQASARASASTTRS